MRSMAHRKADRVLPEPVGATTTQWWPELIASQAPACAVVGAWKLLRNHAAVDGEKRSSTSAGLPLVIGCQPAIPHRQTAPTDCADRLRRGALRCVPGPGSRPEP